MELSLYLAKVLGSYLVIVCVVLLTKRKALSGLIKELTNSTAVLVVSGAFTLLLGLLVVVSHNIWVMDWPVIITILGWLTIAKGVLRLFMPEKVKPMAQKFAGPWLIVWVLFILIVGVYLTYVGFTG